MKCNLTFFRKKEIEGKLKSVGNEIFVHKRE